MKSKAVKKSDSRKSSGRLRSRGAASSVLEPMPKPTPVANNVEKEKKLAPLNSVKKTKLARSRAKSRKKRGTDLEAQVATMQTQIDALCSNLSTTSNLNCPDVIATRYTPTTSVTVPIYELLETKKEDEDDFFTDILDRARILWLIGDWEGLAGIENNQIIAHKHKAKLALLIASAHIQLGEKEKSKDCLLMARRWGISNRLVYKVLTSGLHHSLEKAAHLAGNEQKASLHLGYAMKYKSRIDSRQLLSDSPSSYNNAMRNLDFMKQGNPISDSMIYNIEGYKSGISFEEAELEKDCELLKLIDKWKEYIRNNNLPILAKKLDDSNISIDVMLAEAAHAMQNITHDIPTKKLDITIFDKNKLKKRFIHIKDDYIPMRIKSESNFYESGYLELLGSFQFNGGVVIDVGANIGNHSLYFASEHQAKVFALEPEPHNYFCLSINAFINKQRGCIYALNVACGRERGSINLTQEIENNYGSFKYDTNILDNASDLKNQQPIRIPVYSLDSIFSNKFQGSEIPSIIKVDVEGMEYDVLVGANELITKYCPVIAVECQDHQQFNVIRLYLRKIGYYPFKCLNSTPSFIFLSHDNLWHTKQAQTVLYKESVLYAATKIGFIN
jgi:FkbM family methyltransferase